jgi:hypothetical protein
MRIALALISALTLLGSESLQAQETLGDPAARERERRESIPDTPVLTESDLGSVGADPLALPDESSVAPTSSPKTAASSPSVGTAASGEKKKEKTEEEIRAEREQEWRDRLTAAQAELSRRQAALERMESWRFAFMNPELESANAAVKTAQDAVDALEDERRQNGYR